MHEEDPEMLWPAEQQFLQHEEDYIIFTIYSMVKNKDNLY